MFWLFAGLFANDQGELRHMHSIRLYQITIVHTRRHKCIQTHVLQVTIESVCVWAKEGESVENSIWPNWNEQIPPCMNIHTRPHNTISSYRHNLSFSQQLLYVDIAFYLLLLLLYLLRRFSAQLIIVSSRKSSVFRLSPHTQSVRNTCAYMRVEQDQQQRRMEWISR